LVLGAGSYYFFGRDSGGEKGEVSQRPPSARKPPAVADKKTSTRRERTTVANNDHTKVKRKIRDERMADKPKRKIRGKNMRKVKPKKKSIAG
jgi:hypothetical protein